jgi:hypothetical protein
MRNTPSALAGTINSIILKNSIVNNNNKKVLRGIKLIIALAILGVSLILERGMEQGSGMCKVK